MKLPKLYPKIKSASRSIGQTLGLVFFTMLRNSYHLSTRTIQSMASSTIIRSSRQSREACAFSHYPGITSREARSSPCHYYDSVKASQTSGPCQCQVHRPRRSRSYGNQRSKILEWLDDLKIQLSHLFTHRPSYLFGHCVVRKKVIQ